MMRLDLNQRGYRADFSWLTDLDRIVKKRFVLKQNISLALVSAKEIKKLNKVYRNKDKVTDVLSFNIDGEQILGEVVICLEQARKQAKQNRKTLKSELQWLTVHGILHLLGYDHEKSARADLAQRKEEEEILAKL